MIQRIKLPDWNKLLLYSEELVSQQMGYSVFLPRDQALLQWLNQKLMGIVGWGWQNMSPHGLKNNVCIAFLRGSV